MVRAVALQRSSRVRAAALRRRALHGEGLLDGVEVGAVGRQVEDPCAACRDRLPDAGYLTARQIVQDEQVVGRQRRCQDLLDIGAEQGAIERPVEATVAKMLTFSAPPGCRRTKPPVRPKLDAFTRPSA